MVTDGAEIDALVERLVSGDRRAAARLIGLVENERGISAAVMKRIYPRSGGARVIGITGAQGAGKSTLTGHVIARLRAQGKTVGAVLVDPSSPFSGGAFLGDRVRLDKRSLDPGVYVRSMATRGNLGGLARSTNDAVRIIDALGMDVVIVETVGVGQDEIAIAQIVQTCLLVVTPGLGDDMQAMKAGILEIADVLVMNKADMAQAQACLRNLRMLLGFAPQGEGTWQPPLISTVAAAARPGQVCGIDELMDAIETHRRHLHARHGEDGLRARRAERELDLILHERLEQYVSKALNGTSRRREYLDGILAGRNDPYSVVDEVLGSMAREARGRRSTEDRP